MSKTTKPIVFILILSISILVLTGCQDDTNTQDNQTNNSDQTIDQPIAQEKQQLVLDRHGCIGCGLCSQIAPKNFTISGKKAVVISQNNIDSQEVNSAIKNCPVSVINIIEA